MALGLRLMQLDIESMDRLRGKLTSSCLESQFPKNPLIGGRKPKGINGNVGEFIVGHRTARIPADAISDFARGQPNAIGRSASVEGLMIDAYSLRVNRGEIAV
jgi:hypothetical protein